MSMDCTRWDSLLDEWRDGCLDEVTALSCSDHAADCCRCGEILDLLESVAETDFDGSVDLCADVLEATCGGACGRARVLLGGRSNQDHGDDSDVLLDHHLQHCPDCSELARILDWALPVLNEMGHFETDPVFTYDVLRATSASRARRRSGVVSRWFERTSAWWEDQIRRPQFAAEMAYVATVLAVLIFGTPLSPAQQTPRRVLAAVQTSPAWVMDQGRSLVVVVAGALDATRSEINERRDRTAPDRADLQRHGKELGSALVDRDLKNAEQELDVIRRDIEKLWGTWRALEPAQSPRDSTDETNWDDS